MVPIKQNLVTAAMQGTKCPYVMVASRIVVHNTANDASAENEVSYMRRNGEEISFHYAVDDKEIVQGILENRNAWHAGDGGTGIGNRQGLSIEICYSKSGGEKFIQAEKNAAEFIAMKLKERGWAIDKVTKHQDYSGKYCPHRTLDMGWQRFLNMISSYMSNKPVEPTAPSTGSAKYGVGTPVTYTGLWTQANGGTWYPKAQLSVKEGSITKIVAGAEHPYLINDGIGWANDQCIDDEPTLPCSGGPVVTAPTPSGEKYAIGTPVCVNRIWTQANGGIGYTGDWSGRITDIVHGAEHPYLINNGTGWTNDAAIDSDPHAPR